MCKPICWIIAAIVGVLVGVFSGLSTILAIILAVVVFLALGWLLTKFICGEAEAAQPMRSAAPARPAPAPAPKAAAAAAPAPAPAAAPKTAPVATAAPAPEAPAPKAATGESHWTTAVTADSGKAGSGRGQTGLKPTVELAEEASLRDGVGAWKYQAEASGGSVGDGRVSESPLEPAYTPAPETAPVAEAQPEVLSAARGGAADDLKKIKGVGPGLEKTLNELGFYHYDQIAAWGDAEVAWVDARLKFKGRITRDNWIDQAKELAKG